MELRADCLREEGVDMDVSGFLKVPISLASASALAASRDSNVSSFSSSCCCSLDAESDRIIMLLLRRSDFEPGAPGIGNKDWISILRLLFPFCDTRRSSPLPWFADAAAEGGPK